MEFQFEIDSSKSFMLLCNVGYVDVNYGRVSVKCNRDPQNIVVNGEVQRGIECTFPKGCDRYGSHTCLRIVEPDFAVYMTTDTLIVKY
jgi:hypothetical protein